MRSGCLSRYRRVSSSRSVRESVFNELAPGDTEDSYDFGVRLPYDIHQNRLYLSYAV